MSFDSLGLAEPLLRAVHEAGYTTPTPIQAQAIPAVLSGGDVMGGAQTGTGKTAGTVDLGPRQQTQITGIEIASVSAAPGALAGLVMSTDAGDAVTQVPVLAPNSYYSTVTPTPGETPDGTETDTATTGSAATTSPTSGN